VRGREVSRDPYEILDEISRLEEKNVKEITLLGQNVNSYEYSLNNKIIDFPELLLFLIDNIKKIKWIRFLTSHPKDLSHKLIEVIKSSTLLCKHIHLPVQHGSNAVLKAMKRKYTREKYLSMIEQLKNRISDVSITTDILIGFPGESHEDFVDTVELLKEVRFNDAFTYRYNPREGTEAYNFEDNVPEEVKLERLSEIIELQRSISSEIKSRKIGKTVPVLVESISKKNRDELLCRTERDEMVVFPGSVKSIGDIIDIELVSLSGNTFIGKEVNERICLGG
jgi:tRNA-2-methylthio-N6-dimethylallyladenosine synthase